ncbi:MAG: PIG-L family deacetylase [Bryobacteraceae bacterium]|nr:PIG-L family deacetylase [Bryobacteraceae bacterium]
MFRVILLLTGALAMSFAQETKLRIIAIGAHPDDCDFRFGGTAIKFAKAGHAVKFVSLTNGNAGHHEMGGGMLAMRRHKETQEAARRFGIAEYQVLDNNDGELMPTLEVRKQVIRAIREWRADVVLGPRPNDYHPDHRYTGVVMQDAAYMVQVPNLVSDVPALRKNPIFIYYQDGFQKPSPFRPDVVVAIDDVWEQKVNALDAHTSQMYEWLPWVDGELDQVPKDPAERKKWLSADRTRGMLPDDVKKSIVERYGDPGKAATKHYEAFELCEYGRRPSLQELREMFPK